MICFGTNSRVFNSFVVWLIVFERSCSDVVLRLISSLIRVRASLSDYWNIYTIWCGFWIIYWINLFRLSNSISKQILSIIGREKYVTVVYIRIKAKNQAYISDLYTWLRSWSHFLIRNDTTTFEAPPNQTVLTTHTVNSLTVPTPTLVILTSRLPTSILYVTTFLPIWITTTNLLQLSRHRVFTI